MRIKNKTERKKMKVFIRKMIQYLKEVIEDELQAMDAYCNQFA
jgi:hypothetical protein